MHTDGIVGEDLPRKFMDIGYRLLKRDGVLCEAERRGVPYE